MRQYVLTEEQVNSLGLNKSVIEGCLMIPELGYTKAEMESALGEVIPLDKWERIVSSYLNLIHSSGQKGDIKEFCEFVRKEK